MRYIRDIWYVVAWSHELDGQTPIGRTVAGVPIALFRKQDGTPVAFLDRCPHRHAPLSLGRVEDDHLRCMYHGLVFAVDGRCTEVPGSSTIPPNCSAQVFPAVERWSWIWIWLGDPEKANLDLIPEAYGLDNPEWTMRPGALNYDADYELINDNLCDLSHLDFVHETTLKAATGSDWSLVNPKISNIENGLFVQRWFTNRPSAPGSEILVDSWSRYRYLLPGLFLQKVSSYPVGTAAQCGFGEPTIAPLTERVDQQAVTPIGPGRSRYLYAAGITAGLVTPDGLDRMFAVTEAAFAEDKRIIEAQQAVWDQTPLDCPKAYIGQDKAPAMFRRLIERRISEEQNSEQPVDKPV